MITHYKNLKKENLIKEQNKLKDEFEKFKNMNLKLNMARGKPSPAQLDLSLKMLTDIDTSCLIETKDKQDARNYGLLSGTTEAKIFFSNIFKLPKEMIIIGGNSSLNLMYNYISNAMNFGVLGNTPWNKLQNIKFLCPCPGYDRHFSICEKFNIEMINIDIDKTGPNIKKIKDIVEKDELVKGIWCVPKYSNPTGITYSDEVVEGFAKLKPKANDFRIFWDNAYAVHNIEKQDDKLLNIFDEAKKYGTQDYILEFCSTSKITFPGAGISALAASKKNIEDIIKTMSYQIICFDKINQIRHYMFLPTEEKLKQHMNKHAEILKPKFDAVIEKFEKELKPLGLGNWSKPNGGYFISFNCLDGCAKKIYELCKDVGLSLTEAGATYPYKKDPNDKNIRIAPTYPSTKELETALTIFCLCVKIASIEKLLLN